MRKLKPKVNPTGKMHELKILFDINAMEQIFCLQWRSKLTRNAIYMVLISTLSQK